MKKMLIGVLMVLLIVVVTTFCFTSTVEASNASTNGTSNTNVDNKIDDDSAQGELIKLKENTQSELDGYIEKYGDKSYGWTAFVLNIVRIYSIPFCFLGIAVSAIYKYVIGIRKLDTRDKGLYSLIAFVTIFVICQTMPLVFAIVVRGWRG